MEELLNKLIEKGRVPFGLEGVEKVKYAEQYYRNYSYVFYGGGWQQWRSLRQIVSKESGLWQFVCKNKLLKEEVSICYEGWANVMAEDGCISKHEIGCREIHTNTERGYRIIESAFCDEEDLEQFLLDNIKI